FFLGGLFGGWQDPHGLLFVTYCGFASASTEQKATTAPAIMTAPVSPITRRCHRLMAPSSCLSKGWQASTCPIATPRARNCDEIIPSSNYCPCNKSEHFARPFLI